MERALCPAPWFRCSLLPCLSFLPQTKYCHVQGFVQCPSPSCHTQLTLCQACLHWGIYAILLYFSSSHTGWWSWAHLQGICAVVPTFLQICSAVPSKLSGQRICFSLCLIFAILRVLWLVKSCACNTYQRQIWQPTWLMDRARSGLSIAIINILCISIRSKITIQIVQFFNQLPWVTAAMGYLERLASACLQGAIKGASYFWGRKVNQGSYQITEALPRLP